MTCCHAESRTATPRADATTAHNQLGIRWVWLRIIFAGFLAGNSMTWALAVNVSSATERERMLLHLGLLATTVVVGLLVGGRLLLDSLLALFRFRLSTELLFLCGCLGALAISLWSMIRGSGPVYFEVVSILLVIYRIGVELKAGAKRHAMRAADALSPALNYCEVVREGGRTETCLIESVRAGDDVRCHPGELVPIDGTVRLGQAFVPRGGGHGRDVYGHEAAGRYGTRRFGPDRRHAGGSRQRSRKSADGRPYHPRRGIGPRETHTT